MTLWLSQKWIAFRRTGRVILCSCPVSLLPQMLFEASVGLLCTSSVARLSEGAVKLTTSGRFGYSSVTLTTPRWCRRVSSAKFCGWTLTRTNMFPNLSTGVRISRHGWTGWINHTSMTESEEPESLKEQQRRFGAPFILADCPPHGWGKLSPSKRRLLWEKHWIMHPRREGRLAVGSNSTPSSFTSSPIHWQIDEGI